MSNVCTNRLHVVGPSEAVANFVARAADRPRAYAPATALEMRLVQRIEQGADPLQADRELENWLDSIGAKAIQWARVKPWTRILPAGLVEPDVPETIRAARLAEWIRSVKEEARNADAPAAPTHASAFHLDALRPVPSAVLTAGYDDAGMYWQAEHWGTRRIADHVPPPSIEARSGGRHCAVYSIETFVSPPLEALSFGSIRYPELVFAVAYAEPRMDFYGGATFVQGFVRELGDKDGDELVGRYPSVDATGTTTVAIDAFLADAVHQGEVAADQLLQSPRCCGSGQASVRRL